MSTDDQFDPTGRSGIPARDIVRRSDRYGPPEPIPSYTNKAVVTIVIYGFFWFPGFLSNILFYREAKAEEARLGESLAGVGCLTALLRFNIALIVLGLVSAIGLLSLIVRSGA